jgi:ATP phosphoribosyltransferase
MDARNKVLISMNVPADRLEAVVSTLPALKKPTVAKLHGIEYFSLETVVLKSMVNAVILEVKKIGAEDVIEIPITKIVR